MPTRRWVVACGSLLGVAGLAGCTGRESSGSTTDTGGTADGDATSNINDDAALEATLELDGEKRVLFTDADIASVGAVSTGGRTGPSVPLELSEAGTNSVTETADAVDLETNNEQAMIAITLDGEQVKRLGINAALAEAMANGEWDGRFVLTFADETAAESFHDRLVDESTA
ncbi:MAG: hypothetical protein J07HN4v3_02436 [Halonotius sp. J07HN4]|nr:MAG: hypothetical protein J07HN4v3_02436 [Halonotius sp. J07HN4]